MNAIRRFLRPDVYRHLEPLMEGPLAPEVEAPREHCEDCQIARTHPSDCLCGHCATAGQHVADRMLADRLGSLGLGWY